MSDAENNDSWFRQLKLDVGLESLLPGADSRVLAKTIDFLCVAMIVVGLGTFFDSYFVGVLCGYGWLAVSDWLGSPGKSLLKLKVVDYESGTDCSVLQSIKRNTPFLVISLPQRIHQAVLDLDRRTYREEFTVLVVVLGVLGFAWLVYALERMRSDEEKRRPGDVFGNTIVIRAKYQSLH